MRAVSNLAHAMSVLKDVETALVTPLRFRYNFRKTEKIQKGRLNIYRIPYLSLFHLLPLLRKYDVINIHGVSFFNALMGNRWFHSSSAKIIYTAHGLIPLEKKFGYRYSLIKQYMEKWLVCRSDGITTVSEETKRLIIDAYSIHPDKIHVIGNGVDERFFHPIRAHTKARKDGITRILFVGSIVPIKGLDFLLKSIECVKNLPIVLRLVGNKTSYFNLLKEKYLSLFQNRKVVHTGPAAQNQLMRYYSESDFLVLTSEYDQYPQAVLEAFAMAKPAIISDRVGVKTIFEDGKDGFIVPFNNVGMLAERIKFLTENPDLCRKMGENARIKAEKNAWTLIAKKYVDLFYKMCV